MHQRGTLQNNIDISDFQSCRHMKYVDQWYIQYWIKKYDDVLENTPANQNWADLLSVPDGLCGTEQTGWERDFSSGGTRHRNFNEGSKGRKRKL